MNKIDMIEDLKRVADEVDRELPTRTQYRNLGSFSDHAIKTGFGTFRAFRRAAGLEELTGGRRDRLALARHNGQLNWLEHPVVKHLLVLSKPH